MPAKIILIDEKAVLTIKKLQLIIIKCRSSWKNNHETWKPYFLIFSCRCLTCIPRFTRWWCRRQSRTTSLIHGSQWFSLNHNTSKQGRTTTLPLLSSVLVWIKVWQPNQLWEDNVMFLQRKHWFSLESPKSDKRGLLIDEKFIYKHIMV